MRISCTTLESFRRYMNEDWMSEADLLATIRGTRADSPAMALGRAFENVLMDPDRYRVAGGFRADGYTFDDATMREPLALVDPRGSFQVKATKAYDDVDVVAKADQLVGLQVCEWKTTTGSFDIDQYLGSYQYRFMVDIFEASVVTFHVFCLDDHKNDVVEVRSIESFNVYPYPELHADCCRLLARFREYVDLRGLGPILRERQRLAGVA